MFFVRKVIGTGGQVNDDDIARAIQTLQNMSTSGHENVVQIIDHGWLRGLTGFYFIDTDLFLYATTLVLGRYTEWTAKHPDYLEIQLKYISTGFEKQNREVISAAAQALKHFCQDCKKVFPLNCTSLIMAAPRQLRWSFAALLSERCISSRPGFIV